MQSRHVSARTRGYENLTGQKFRDKKTKSPAEPGSRGLLLIDGYFASFAI